MQDGTISMRNNLNCGCKMEHILCRQMDCGCRMELYYLCSTIYFECKMEHYLCSTNLLWMQNGTLSIFINVLWIHDGSFCKDGGCFGYQTWWRHFPKYDQNQPGVKIKSGVLVSSCLPLWNCIMEQYLWGIT